MHLGGRVRGDAAGAMGDQRDVDVEALSQGTPRLAALAAEELDNR